MTIRDFTSAIIFASIIGTHPCFAECVKAKYYGQTCLYDVPPYWWVGSWAYEEHDQCGDKFLALLFMTKEGTFLKHLIASDRSTRSIWGSYQIDFSPLDLGDKKEFVPLQRAVPNRLKNQIAAISRFDFIAKYFYDYVNNKKTISGMYPQHGLSNVISGSITLKIEHKLPDDYNVGTSQKYEFLTQGPGYMKFLGPGASDDLVKQYSDHIINGKN